MSARSTVERAFGPVARSVAEGRIPGAILGVVEAGGDRAWRVAGDAQRLPAARPMTEGTWFDLASLTKVIFTTPHILALAEAGAIDLDAPLTTVIPDLRQYNPDLDLGSVRPGTKLVIPLVESTATADPAA